MIELAWWQWLIAVIGALSIGIAKTGVPGFGIFVVPVFALLVGDGVGSAGWLLPLLIAADIFAVAYHRRHAQIPRLVELVPWVLIGMAVGGVVMAADRWWLRDTAGKSAGNMLIGALILTMVVVHVWRTWRPAVTQDRAVVVAKASGRGQAAVYGIAAGFTTFLANAAGPVMNLYFLAKRFPKEQLIGTGAWFFLVVNVSKVPIYAPLGQFTATSLLFDLILLPAVIVGAVTGKRIFAVLPQQVFANIVLILAAVAAVVLMVPR